MVGDEALLKQWFLSNRHGISSLWYLALAMELMNLIDMKSKFGLHQVECILKIPLSLSLKFIFAEPIWGIVDILREAIISSFDKLVRTSNH